MGNKTKLGTAFNEKINSLNKIPDDIIWTGIEVELNKKKKRRIAYFWFWLTPLLVISGIISTAFYLNFSDDNSLNQQPLEVNKKSENSTQNNSEENYNTINIKKIDLEKTRSNSIKSELSKNNVEEKNKALDVKTSLTKNRTSRNSTSTNKAKNASLNNKKTKLPLISRNKNKIVKPKNITNKEFNNEKKSVIKTQNQDPKFDLTFSEALHRITETDSVIKNDSISKIKEKVKNIKMFPERLTKKDSSFNYKNFEIDIFLSPTIYSTFSNKSLLDNRLDNASKKFNVQTSFGLGLSYNFSEKISVRIGYGISNYSLTTSNVLINTSNYSYIDYDENSSNQSLFVASNNSETMQITQKISYSEIPVEVKYLLLNKKVSVEGIAGFSFLYLNKNEIIIKAENGFSKSIGQTSNLMKTNLSVNVGLGLNYKLNNRLKLILEPVVNYHLNTFQNSNSAKPYSFGVRTGLRYSFNKK
ncbi:hypothetical protein [Flavobacterium sp.]